MPRVSVREYRDNLGAIIRLAQVHHAIVVLLTRPFIGDASSGSWKVRAPVYVKATIEVASANRVPCIDVYAYFSDKPEYFIDESHFTRQGHLLAAQFVYDQVKPLIR